MNDPRILVIEDTKFWQEQLPKVLRKGLGEHLRIEVAVGHQAALELIRSEEYHLISVDLALPVDLASRDDTGPGMELLKVIRNNSLSRNCGMIVLSGYGTVNTVRDALLSYQVSDFIDKLEFEEVAYVRAAQRAIRNSLLAKAQREVISDFRLTVGFNESGFLQTELVGPGHRSTYRNDSGATTDFADLIRRADDLNRRITRPDGDWRAEARSIGKTLYEALNLQPGLREALTVARALVGNQTAKLSLLFEGPPSALGVPFELMRQTDYLVYDYVMSRRVVDEGAKYLQRAQTFREFLESIISRQETLRVLVIGVDSDGMIPDAPDEARVVAQGIKQSLSVLGVPHFVRTLIGSEATVRDVAESLRSGYHLVHYSGHGSYNSELAEGSSLILWDGRLRASDLKLLLKPTELYLMFLSCCLGGRSSRQPSRGDFHGFFDALSQANTPVMLGYRWQVDDLSAKRLATKFYRDLFSVFCPGKALLEARSDCAQGPNARDDATWASPILVVSN